MKAVMATMIPREDMLALFHLTTILDRSQGIFWASKNPLVVENKEKFTRYFAIVERPVVGLSPPMYVKTNTISFGKGLPNHIAQIVITAVLGLSSSIEKIIVRPSQKQNYFVDESLLINNTNACFGATQSQATNVRFRDKADIVTFNRSNESNSYNAARVR